jgi:hypothetical protein
MQTANHQQQFNIGSNNSHGIISRHVIYNPMKGICWIVIKPQEQHSSSKTCHPLKWGENLVPIKKKKQEQIYLNTNTHKETQKKNNKHHEWTKDVAHPEGPYLCDGRTLLRNSFLFKQTKKHTRHVGDEQKNNITNTMAPDLNYEIIVSYNSCIQTYRTTCHPA